MRSMMTITRSFPGDLGCPKVQKDNTIIPFGQPLVQGAYA
jgi:hypothetical protein